MKRLKTLWMVLALASGATACGGDKTNETPQPGLQTPVVRVSGTSVEVSCTTTFGAGVLDASTAGFVCTAASGETYEASNVTVSANRMSGTLLGLKPETDHTVRAYAVLGGHRYESPEAAFRTGESAGPKSRDLTRYTGWAELPQTDPDAEDYFYAVHTCTGLPGGRNYTTCYGLSERGGLWSAFPLHECYRGSQKRTDKWAYDPEVPQSLQPALVKGSYQPQSGYSRGHLMASEDRTFNYEANAQTFYVTNMAPQWQNSFNGGVWSSLEADCWNNICADTLYVVSGVWGVHDSARVTDKEGVSCTVPSHFFRVLLRSKKGNTGKRVQDLAADELQCVGFWFENRAYPSGKPSANMTSVAEIERLTGLHFFVNVPQAPKESYDDQAWSFR